MAKPLSRPYSRYAAQAAELLGLTIHEARIRRGMTAAEAAERAGISRGLVNRIEKGEMSCAIGAAFELAAILGVPLFDAEPTTLTRYLTDARDKVALLPKKAGRTTQAVKDDF